MNAYCDGMKTIVSERGQITLPKSIRTDLGIRAGTVLELAVIEGRIVGWKQEGQDLVHKWRGKGSLPQGVDSVDDYLKTTRA